MICYKVKAEIGAIKMKIKKVAVLGAGAVGSYIIWGLSKVKGIELGVVADGNRARRLKKAAVSTTACITPRCGLHRRLTEQIF